MRALVLDWLGNTVGSAEVADPAPEKIRVGRYEAKRDGKDPETGAPRYRAKKPR